MDMMKTKWNGEADDFVALFFFQVVAHVGTEI